MKCLYIADQFETCNIYWCKQDVFALCFICDSSISKHLAGVRQPCVQNRLAKLFSWHPDPAQSNSGAGACSRIALMILMELGKSFGVSMVLHHGNRRLV